MAIASDVRNFMRDAEMMLRINRNLHAVADNPRALATVAVERASGSASEICSFIRPAGTVASCKNDDGTNPSSRSIPCRRFNFVVGKRDGKSALIVRNAQYEYAFVESAP